MSSLLEEAGTMRVECPSCHAILRMPGAVTGEIVSCPKCSESMEIPKAPRTRTTHTPRARREPSSLAIGLLAGGIVLALMLGLGIWLIVRKSKAPDDAVNDPATEAAKANEAAAFTEREPDWGAAAKKEGWTIRTAADFIVAMPGEMLCSDDHIKEPDVPRDLKARGITRHLACKHWKGANDPEYTVAVYERLLTPFPTATAAILDEYRKLHPEYFEGQGQFGYEITAVVRAVHNNKDAAMVSWRSRSGDQFFITRLIADGNRLFALSMSQPRKPVTEAEAMRYFQRFTIRPKTR